MALDEIDTNILKNLLVDAKLLARHLAYKIGLSTVPVLTRIKYLNRKKSSKDCCLFRSSNYWL